MSQPKGMLFVTMEPQAVSEEEFNDWYDTEHLPERAGIDGFLSALRYVCVQGWPRYLALYDLESLEVLSSDGYLSLAGDHFTPWSKRVLPRVQGQYRAEAELIHPADAVTLTDARCGRLAAYRFRDVSEQRRDAVVEALRERFEADPAVAQLRVLRVVNHGGRELLALVEQRSPLRSYALDLALIPSWSGTVDLVNLYSPYWRRGTLAGVM